jgi:hypothetical protein
MASKYDGDAPLRARKMISSTQKERSNLPASTAFKIWFNK